MSSTSYFQSHHHYFWQWEEQMNVIAIPAERTIAYRELVMDIIEKVAPQGLPPLGSLLLALVATNPGGSTSLEAIDAILKNTLQNDSNTILSEAIDFLNLLTEIPQTYKEGKKRTLLFMALFQHCHGILSLKDSAAICEFFRANRGNIGAFDKKRDFNYDTFIRDFRTIGLLKNKFKSIDQLLEKVAAIPEFPDKIELPENNIAPAETTDLIEDLVANTKTYQVGALVKRIWSALNIPVHSSLPSQQPLGGISDLTTKGDFDKLLISEFANDDIVFLSRLANNEALYIHREIPPASNKLQRIILIDVSIKNWGTPKIIAFATMLAIARHPKTDIECTVFAIGNTFYPVSYNNIHTIIEALQLLEGSLHAGAGLDDFFNSNPENKNREVFLITESSAARQAEWLKVLGNHQNRIHYWIYTDREGNIDIYKKQQSSKKHIQHLRLPLHEIWNRQPGPEKKEADSPHDLVTLPILVPNSASMRRVLGGPDGEIFQITNGKNLLRLYDKTPNIKKGWELIYDKLPFFNGEFAMGQTPNGRAILLMFNPQNKSLTLLHLQNGEKIPVLFTQWKPAKNPSFFFHEEKFHHINSSGHFAITLKGLVEENATIDPKIIDEKNKELTNLQKTYASRTNLFKKIHTVFINDRNNLVFNVHELYLNRNGHIKLDPTGNLNRIITAAQTNHQTEFTFNDGSRVEVTSSGMLVLKSSNPLIAPVFVPSLIDTSLGVATTNDFAGNTYFYKEPLYDLKLKEVGSSPLETVKLVRDIGKYGLAEAKNLVDGAPSTIIEALPYSKCNQLQRQFEYIGNVMQIVANPKLNPFGEKIEPITAEDFFKKHIEAFIENIQLNGVKA